MIIVNLSAFIIFLFRGYLLFHKIVRNGLTFIIELRNKSDDDDDDDNDIGDELVEFESWRSGK